jgi:hypothetical protein
MANKVLAAVVAGGILVGAGLVASAVSSPSTAAAQEGTDEKQSDGPIPRVMGLLEEVLDDLVGDDTITQAQADAIIEATEAKASEVRAELRENRELLEGLLDDGVITEEEASRLPDDHFLLDDRFDEAWEDGELSVEDLRGLHHGLHRPFRHGLRIGALLDDGGIDQGEYDALPEDHPLKQIDVSEYLEDGQITPDEFREIFSDLADAHSDANA